MQQCFGDEQGELEHFFKTATRARSDCGRCAESQIAPQVMDFSSIDEFLAGYRHELTSILDFLSSLDDLAASSQRDGSPMAQKNSPMAIKSTRPLSFISMAPSRKRPRSNSDIPAEAREEQRRIKNREYQRRFRERRRLLQYRFCTFMQ